MTSDNPEDAIDFLFHIFDRDGMSSNNSSHFNHSHFCSDDGFLTTDDLAAALRASMQENNMKFDKEEIDELVLALWEDAGLTEDELMALKNLRQILMRHDGLVAGLAKSLTAWLLPNFRKPKTSSHSCWNPFQICRTTMAGWFSDMPLFMTLCVIIGINIAVFTWRALQFVSFKHWTGASPNYFFMMSRANGKKISNKIVGMSIIIFF